MHDVEMKHVIDTSEVLGTVETPEGTCDVCAAASASFDEENQRHFRLDWLPKNETVTESVAREECHDVTREIFQRWVRKVREAVPALHPACL